MAPVHLLRDAEHTLSMAGEQLAASPVLHNVILTLLSDRAANGRPGRYWVVQRSGGVAGVALQSPLDFATAVSVMDADALDDLVPAMLDEAPDLPGVVGEASVAAAFAGRWCEQRRVPGTPEYGMRLHLLGQLVPPVEAEGRLRPAVNGDQALVAAWVRGFNDETHGGDADASETARRLVSSSALWIWEDGRGRPVSCTAAQPAQAGIQRINFVYTPPELRRRGFAASCVAAVSARVLASGAGCMLYTDLANPTSNAIYQRLGYRAVAEATKYRFG